MGHPRGLPADAVRSIYVEIPVGLSIRRLATLEVLPKLLEKIRYKRLKKLITAQMSSVASDLLTLFPSSTSHWGLQHFQQTCPVSDHSHRDSGVSFPQHSNKNVNVADQWCKLARLPCQEQSHNGFHRLGSMSKPQTSTLACFTGVWTASIM